MQIDPSAPFAVAFSAVGYEWAQYVVSIGALLAVTNTVVAIQYALRCVAFRLPCCEAGLPACPPQHATRDCSAHHRQAALCIPLIPSLTPPLCPCSRVFVVLGRFNVLPPALSRVHPRTQVPMVSTLLCGVISAVLATFVPLSTLSGLVALGTLVAFLMVCLGVIWRRLHKPSQGQSALPAAAPLTLLTLAAAALGVTYQLETHYGVWIACLGGRAAPPLPCSRLGASAALLLPALHCPACLQRAWCMRCSAPQGCHATPC